MACSWRRGCPSPATPTSRPAWSKTSAGVIGCCLSADCASTRASSNGRARVSKSSVLIMSFCPSKIFLFSRIILIPPFANFSLFKWYWPPAAAERKDEARTPRAPAKGCRPLHSHQHASSSQSCNSPDKKGSFFTLDNSLQPMLLLVSDRSVFKGTLAKPRWVCFSEYLGINFFECKKDQSV